MKALLAQVASLGQQLVRAHLDDLFHFHASLSGSHVMPAQKLRAHGQFIRGQAKRFTRNGFRHTIQFKQNVARSHRRDPEFGLAFALTHARFRRTARDRFIGKNADPEFAFAFHIARKGHTRRFQLSVGDPRAFESLQAKFAKVDSEITRSGSLAASPLGLPILHAFWHQWHNNSSLNCPRNRQRWWRTWWWRSRLGCRFFLLTDPTFHPNFAINCIGLGESIIDRRPQRVQGYFAFPIPFRPRDLRAIETPRTSQPNPLRTEIHRGLHRFFHRTAICDAPLNLQRDVLCHQLCIQLRRLDLLDVDLDLLALRHFRDLFRHLFDLRAFAADHDPGTGGENRHANAVPRPLDHDLRDGGELQFFLHIAANFQIAMQKRRQFLRRSVPARTPVAVHAQAKPNWINFLSHKNQCLIPSEIISSLSFQRSFLPSAFFPSRSLAFQLVPRLLLASWTLSFPVVVSFSSFPAFRFESHRLIRCEYDSCALKCGCHCLAHAPSSA